MRSIAIFDFDGTIYKKDSFIEFCVFVYKKHPLKIIYLFPQVFLFIQFKLKQIDAGEFKSKFMCYLNGCTDKQVEDLVLKFWNKTPPSFFNDKVLNEIENERIKGNEIVCISASPDFLLNHICAKLKIDHLICSKTINQNNKTALTGKNCRGQEKVNQLNLLFNNDYQVSCAVSDNEDDHYILELAERQIKIIKGKLAITKL